MDTPPGLTLFAVPPSSHDCGMEADYRSQQQRAGRRQQVRRRVRQPERRHVAGQEAVIGDCVSGRVQRGAPQGVRLRQVREHVRPPERARLGRREPRRGAAPRFQRLRTSDRSLLRPRTAAVRPPRRCTRSVQETVARKRCGGSALHDADATPNALPTTLAVLDCARYGGAVRKRCVLDLKPISR